MSAVTQNDITEAYKRVGAVPGDTIVYHGSMKSIGYVEGGADALIDGILNSAAPGGTAAIGTLWYNGKVEERPPEKFDIATSPAYNGAMAEAMRLDPRSVRSNNFSHSVNAVGARKFELTENHGEGKKYATPWDDEAFAEISPWTKFYTWNALYTFIGVDLNVCTMKHLIEGRFVDKYLSLLPVELRQEYRLRLAHDLQPGPWPYFNMVKMRPILEMKNLITYTTLGNATLMAIRTRPMVEETLKELEKAPVEWMKGGVLAWVEEIKNYHASHQ